MLTMFEHMDQPQNPISKTQTIGYKNMHGLELN